MDSYGKIGNNRIVKFAAKREGVGGSHLSSKSVRDCRLSDKRPPYIRVPADTGITAGRVNGAEAYREYETPIRGQRKRQIASEGLTARQRRGIARKLDQARRDSMKSALGYLATTL